MRIEDATLLLAEIAAAYPVTRLTHRGVDLWPIVRDRLRHGLTKGHLVPSRGTDPGTAFPGPHGQRLGLTLADPLGDPRRAVILERWQAEDEARAWRRRIGGPVDLVVLARAEDASDRIGGKPYDRYVDPLIQLARGRGITVLKVMHGPEAGLDESLAVPAWRHPITWPDTALPMESTAPALFHFTAWLPARFGLGLDPWALIAEARNVRLRARALWPLLLAAAPRAVVSVCYFAPLSAALTYTAKALGIRAVDLQHGKQGPYSPYSHWGRMADGGYDTLPDLFWTWGEISAEAIARHLPAVEGAPEVIVGGNPWPALWLAGRGPAGALPEPLERRLEPAERVILVSLQPIDEPFPAHLLDAIARAPRSWLWLIRLHPHMRKDLDRHAARLPAGANVEVEHSSQGLLYALLRRAQLHLTCWSTVGYEAQLMGVPTGILHPQGIGLYRAELAQGVFRAALDADAVLALAATLPPVPPSAFIRTDAATIAAALDRLVRR